MRLVIRSCLPSASSTARLWNLPLHCIAPHRTAGTTQMSQTEVFHTYLNVLVAQRSHATLTICIVHDNHSTTRKICSLEHPHLAHKALSTAVEPQCVACHSIHHSCPNLLADYSHVLQTRTPYPICHHLAASAPERRHSRDRSKKRCEVHSKRGKLHYELR